MQCLAKVVAQECRHSSAQDVIKVMSGGNMGNKIIRISVTSITVAKGIVLRECEVALKPIILVPASLMTDGVLGDVHLVKWFTFLSGTVVWVVLHGVRGITFRLGMNYPTREKQDKFWVVMSTLVGGAPWDVKMHQCGSFNEIAIASDCSITICTERFYSEGTLVLLKYCLFAHFLPSSHSSTMHFR